MDEPEPSNITTDPTYETVEEIDCPIEPEVDEDASGSSTVQELTS